MSRPLRIEFAGAIYHITSRGNAGQIIFRNDEDRKSFLRILGSVIDRFGWICHAYCLMTNHYHLLIETPGGNLSRGMRQLNGVYTQKVNWKHKTTGHIFQGRYKAILVDKDHYLLELCRYIVLNPVRAHLVEDLEKWAWSSYQATVGKVRVPSFLTVDWVLGQFNQQRGKAQKQYRGFVNDGIKGESPWKDLMGQIFLGDRNFLEKICVSPKDDLKEIPATQRLAGRPPLCELFAGEAQRSKPVRNKAIRKAYVEYGYTLKEIAHCLKIHYATASRAVAEIENV